MKAIRGTVVGSLTCALVWGCGDGSSSLDLETGPLDSTWSIIQSTILETNCVECHVAGASFAQQSDLVLTADVAYRQLINRAPDNAAARAEGLTLVGTQGLASVDKSFFWEKINAPNQEHYFDDHPGYGALMPLGAPSLTNGELEYILQWILAGAPETGHVAEQSLLDNTERYEPPEFTQLPVPSNGIQLHLGPYDVAPNFEREFYYYQPLENDEDLFVNRVDIAMRSGSHHLILYGLTDDVPAVLRPEPNVIRDIRDPDGNYLFQNLLVTQYHQFVSGTQWPLMTYHFPPGVALRIPSGSGFDLNPHNVNRTGEVRQGEVYVNLHTVESAQVEHVAELLNMNNVDFSLPPNTVTTVSKTFGTDERIRIFQLFSHAHEHMTEFKVFIDGGPRSGELVYIAYDWAHPPILELDPPLVLEPGQGLRLETTYNNTSNRTLRFGLLSVDEMMILFGAYYRD
jgi:hypothetical protein